MADLDHFHHDLKNRCRVASGSVQLLIGEVSDRTGTLPVIALMLALVSVGLGSIVLLTGVEGPLAFGTAVVCLGFGSHGYRPVRGAYLMSVISASVAGEASVRCGRC